jgi:hypothetical protein
LRVGDLRGKECECRDGGQNKDATDAHWRSPDWR